MRGVSGENLSPREGEDRCPSLRRQAGRGQIFLSSSFCSVQLCKELDCIYPHGRGQSILSVQFSSVTQLCQTLCDPMDCSMAGFPVHHQLPEPTQTHVLWVGDAIQPSHPLLSPSPSAFSLSQHQGLFKWVSSLNQVAIERTRYAYETTRHNLCSRSKSGKEKNLRGRHGNPLQCSCLEHPHGQRSLVGYSPWGCKESDTTERLSTAQYKHR